MMVAQQLYEGVEVPGEGSVGLITYMRTDSTRVSEDALREVRGLIEKEFGKQYLPDAPNHFRTRAKGAQEAHEAIRPTDVTRTPQALKSALAPDQLKLYTLIWNKFVASQMKPGLANVTTAVFAHGDARFVAQGEVEVFDGHTRLFATALAKDEAEGPQKLAQKGGAAAPAERDDQVLPKSLKKGNAYTPRAVDPSQHFTQPPPRYSEATLVKELEKKGIGRPSTYATIISTIQDRGYVTLEARKFKATELGEIVTDQLVEHFKDILDTDFTASMEEGLDKVESGDGEWRRLVHKFYEPFMKDLGRAERAMKDMKREPELTDRMCDKCGAPMAVLYNKRGKFLGCSKYPECKNTMPVDGPREQSQAIPTDYRCPKCEKPMVIRTGKRGRFLACTGFPKCKSTASVDDQGKIIEAKPTGVNCEKCGKPMVIKGSRRGPFLACTGFPKCRNAKPLPEELREKPKETGEICEKCGKPMVQKTSRWGKPFLSCSGYPDCKNARNIAPAESPDGDGSLQPIETSRNPEPDE
jgi:DNA topoisomerase-1